MESKVDKPTQDVRGRITEVFWIAVKVAVIATIILLLLQVLPIRVELHQTARW